MYIDRRIGVLDDNSHLFLSTPLFFINDVLVTKLCLSYEYLERNRFVFTNNESITRLKDILSVQVNFGDQS